MPFVILGAAVLVEVLGTSLLKTTEGFTKLWPTVACLTAYACSILLLSQAVKDIPVGIVYALWSGLGTAAIVAISIAFLGESLSVAKLAGVALIVAGVVVVNLAGVT